MDMFDEARAMRSTMELCHLTQRELGERLGTSQSYVANKLRLLDYTDEDIERIRKYSLTERHARAILRLPSDMRGEVILLCAKGQLTVRECEAIVDTRVLPRVAKLPSRKDGLDAIAATEEAMRKCVEELTSRGILARMRSGYVGGDMYITLFIKDA